LRGVRKAQHRTHSGIANHHHQSHPAASRMHAWWNIALLVVIDGRSPTTGQDRCRIEHAGNGTAA
ncbi:MAG: hypothetical protein ACK56F_28065, partial [bacterium]